MILNTHIKKVSLFLMIGIALTIISCDERIVGDDSNYTLTITSKAFVGSTYSSFSDDNIVGEDVVGEAISTLIEVKLTDVDEKPVKDKTIYFTARKGNSTYGSFDLDEGKTGEDGTISVVYSDGTGSGAVDISSTDAFEGVTVTGKVNDSFSADTQFDVYGSQSDVWPYSLSLSADVNSIIMDGSATDVDLTLTLSNKLGSAGGNMNVTLTSDKGGFNTDGLKTTSVLMDETGKGTLTFDENYSQDDLGIATIIASYTHQGFSDSVHDTIFVSISDMYQVSISQYSFSYDSGSNIVLVGEDIAGDYAQTMLVATVTDSANAPVGGIDLSFSSTVMGAEAGTITAMSNVTDLTGRLYAIFDDGGNSYKDTPGTPSFEGVTATVRYGENLQVSTSFNVYDQSDVWPYTLNASTNTDVIYVDGGETKATITSYMINAMGHPVENALISYETTLGYIIPGDGDYKTDSTGVDSVFFTDAGDPEDVGVATVTAGFVHPGFSLEPVSDNLQVYIEDPTFQECTYIHIPASVPGSIVVKDGGGTESTTIKAEIYDDSNNLVDTPTLVRFKLQPILNGCYLEEPGITDTTVYSVNGVATVSVNSGTRPGPVRIEVSTECNNLEAVAVPVLIEAGAPYYIEANWSVNSTEAAGACFYKRQLGALVYDRYHNPVEDSTYVYWTIEHLDTNIVASAEVYGTSFTFNEPWEQGADTTHGLAFSTMVYNNDFQGQNCIVTAYTWGDDINGDNIYGDSVGTIIDTDQGYSQVSLFEPTVTLSVPITAYDFTIPFPTDSLVMTLTARVTTFGCDEPIEGVAISFNGNNIAGWKEYGYENEWTDLNGSFTLDEIGEGWIDEGLDGVLSIDLNNDGDYFDAGDIPPDDDGTEGDGLFSWRDYGADNDPSTADEGNYNEDHDAIDTDNDGAWDVAEVSEFFNDWGLDGIPDTFDEGEGNGEWDGYHMLNGFPIVKTDKDGKAIITIIFIKEQCFYETYNTDEDLCYWNPANATISATTLIPTFTSSDPVNIGLSRSPTPGPCQ